MFSSGFVKNSKSRRLGGSRASAQCSKSSNFQTITKEKSKSRLTPIPLQTGPYEQNSFIGFKNPRGVVSPWAAHGPRAAPSPDSPSRFTHFPCLAAISGG